jgi:site-specific DNA-methyltransferase (adenine-specific)
VFVDLPYFGVVADDWDNQWKDRNEYLDWVVSLAHEWKRITKSNSSIFVFCDEKMEAYIQVRLDEIFLLLNKIVWYRKTNEMKKFAHNFRTFAPATERALFYTTQQDVTGLVSIMPVIMEKFQKYFSDAIPLKDWNKVAKSLSVSNTAVRHWVNYPTQPSLLEQYKYSYTWIKSLGTNFLHAKNAPIKLHEDIVVFSKGSINHPSVSDKRMTYNPQMVSGGKYKRKRVAKDHKWNNQMRPSTDQTWITSNNGFRYPTSVLEFANGNNHNDGHPTQKPVDLYRWLILTYSNEDETIFDCTMGSGTTGVAAVMEGRRFIGIEISPEYFAIAEARLKEAVLQPSLFTPSNKACTRQGQVAPQFDNFE